MVQVGLLHAKFEILHLFEYGNGRTGFLKIPLFNTRRAYSQNPAFYLSEYLTSHRAKYYNRLLMINEEDDRKKWIDFFLTAVIETGKGKHKQG